MPQIKANKAILEREREREIQIIISGIALSGRIVWL